MSRRSVWNERRNREEVADDCQPKGGLGAKVDGMVSICELLINVVRDDKPKRLTGLSQTARSAERTA